LLDIATNFASGKEVVGAIFSDGNAKGKQKVEATKASASQDPKKKKKGRKGKQCQSDDNLVAVADCKNPKWAPIGPSLFNEMLKKPCPYHRGPTKHTIEEYTLKKTQKSPPRTTTPRGKASPRSRTVS